MGSVLLGIRVLRNVFDALEASGIRPDAVVQPLGTTSAEMLEQDRIDWTTLMRVLDEVAVVVDHSPERLISIGRRMTHAPSYSIGKVAAFITSPRTLLEFAERWVAPANFPHLHVFMRFVTNERVHLRVEIPKGYATSKTFFYIVQGSFETFPELVGLGPATIAESEVGQSSLQITAILPRANSLMERGARRVRQLLQRSRREALRDEQQEALLESVEALQRGRNEQRAMLERLPDLVLVHVAGRIVWVNPAFIRTFGYTCLDDLVGTPVIDLVPPKDRDYVLKQMQLKPVEQGGEPSLQEAVLIAQSGALIVTEIAPTQAVIFDGVPARMIVGRDVTERQRMQQKLIIADRLASVGLLAAGVAHEINNPLGYVLNNIEIARNGLNPNDEQSAKSLQALSVALEGVDRIRMIVRDLLMLSRGERGIPSLVDLESVAESTLALASHEVERTTKLVRSYEPAPPVLSSEARISQILLNLIVNALESMRGRPRDTNELVVKIAADGTSRALLQISDTGVGIEDADVGRLFDPFFTTKPSGQGTGLGLSIVQQLVVEMGGEINVSSALGTGTTFRVLLPAAQ